MSDETTNRMSRCFKCQRLIRSVKDWVNICLFHPELGGGIVYATKGGAVRSLKCWGNRTEEIVVDGSEGSREDGGENDEIVICVDIP